MLSKSLSRVTNKPEFYDVVKHTPLDQAEVISDRLGNRVYLKREDLQPIHSFKLRGALHKMLSLSRQQLSHGVITASAGNHAQGVALSAQLLDTSALIVMPKTTPDIKVAAVKRYGAEIVLHGRSYSEAYDHCMRLSEQTERSFIHPFDDELVIDGQGTVAAEILDQLPEVDYIFVPVGGGGLLAGVAKAAKEINPRVKIIGVEPDDSNAMTESLRTRRRVALDKVGIFADGVAVKQVGQLSWEIASQYVDGMIEVSPRQISQAIKQIFEDSRAIMEPAGALAVAGAAKYMVTNDLHHKKVAVICSGANMSFDKLKQIVEMVAE